jgi:hypothetical protein
MLLKICDLDFWLHLMINKQGVKEPLLKFETKLLLIIIANFCMLRAGSFCCEWAMVLIRIFRYYGLEYCCLGTQLHLPH